MGILRTIVLGHGSGLGLPRLLAPQHDLLHDWSATIIHVRNQFWRAPRVYLVTTFVIDGAMIIED